MNNVREILTEGVIPLVGMSLSFGAVLFIFIVMTRARPRRLEIQAALQGKLIDKFGSTAELVTFLQSAAGRQFVSGVQQGNVTHVQDRVLAGLRRAILISALGLGFIVLWGITGFIGLAWPCVLLLVLGLGYFGATAITMKFARQEEQSLTPIVPTNDVR